ncbi:Vasohibin-domain-containing protein [Powellomyces hirtus]|nr:Vasohibin-domain-containing protein [Powellomyces hirtus]
MEEEHPEFFTSEKWNNVLSFAASRIQLAGGVNSVLRCMNLPTLDDEAVAEPQDLQATLKALALSQTMPTPSVPRPPMCLAAGASLVDKLKSVQTYIDRLGYNHLGTTFFEIRKSASVRSLMKTAQEMIVYGLPIKCLEAVVLATYLTAPMMDIERIPCSFKSECGLETYRHIVLLIRHGDRWGALGISRRPDLMDKPLSFKSLPEILKEFKKAYENNGHRLVKIKLGLPITHDTSSNERFTWKYLSLYVNALVIQDQERQLDKYIRGLRGG